MFGLGCKDRLEFLSLLIFFSLSFNGFKGRLVLSKERWWVSFPWTATVICHIAIAF